MSKLSQRVDEGNAVLKEALAASKSEIVGLGLDAAGKFKPLGSEPSANAWFKISRDPNRAMPTPLPADVIAPHSVSDVRGVKQEHALILMLRCEIRRAMDADAMDQFEWRKAVIAAKEAKPPEPEPKQPPKREPKTLAAVKAADLHGYCRTATWELVQFLKPLESVYIIKPVYVTATSQAKSSTTDHYFVVAAPKWDGGVAPASEAIIIDITWSQFALKLLETPIPNVYPLTLAGTVDEIRRSREFRGLMESREFDPKGLGVQGLLARYEAGAYAMQDVSYRLW